MIRSEGKKMLKINSTKSPQRVLMKLLRNWNPPKNRKKSPAQKIALQMAIITRRSLDPDSKSRKPFETSRHRRTQKAEATRPGGESLGGIGWGFAAEVMGCRPST